jgi:hypothetical protein
MAKIKQHPVPKMFVPILKQSGIKIKNYKSATSFEKDLLKFLKRNHVLHLGTSKNDYPRVTPLEYRLIGLTFYILSEGGGKFNNLKANKKVCFGISEPYDSTKDFFGAKGLQAWGTAKVYSMKENLKQFQSIIKKMSIQTSLNMAGQKDLPSGLNFRIIEIKPNKIKYGNTREGIYNITWLK